MTCGMIVTAKICFFKEEAIDVTKKSGLRDHRISMFSFSRSLLIIFNNIAVWNSHALCKIGCRSRLSIYLPLLLGKLVGPSIFSHGSPEHHFAMR